MGFWSSTHLSPSMRANARTHSSRFSCGKPIDDDCETKIYFEKDIVNEIKKVFGEQLEKKAIQQKKIDEAIELLKSEGYTITKEF
jgi:hypothetical protein